MSLTARLVNSKIVIDDIVLFMLHIEGNLTNGDFPKRQRKYVEVWADIHKDELIANWQITQEDGDPFKIEPLK